LGGTSCSRARVARRTHILYKKHAQYDQNPIHLLFDPVLPNTPHAQRRRVLGPHQPARAVRGCYHVHPHPRRERVCPHHRAPCAVPGLGAGMACVLPACFQPPSKLYAFAASSTSPLLASQASTSGGSFRATRAGEARTPAHSPVSDRRCAMHAPLRCAPRFRGCRLRVRARPHRLRSRARLLLRDSKDRSYGSDYARPRTTQDWERT
jgi:hypothetical protein